MDHVIPHPGRRTGPTDRQVSARRLARSAAAVRDHGRSDGPALSTIVLDLGGVVVPTLFEVVDDSSFPSGPFGHDPKYADVESGRIQERDYWAQLSASRPDLDIASFMRTRLSVRDEVRAMLPEMRGRVRIAALTNDMGHWFGEDWRTRFPDFTHFDVLLEASRYGVLKPDPAVFRWALGELDTPAHRCLFVDDLPSNLRGASAVGMATELFSVTDPSGSVRRILDRLWIRPNTAPGGAFFPEKRRHV